MRKVLPVFVAAVFVLLLAAGCVREGAASPRLTGKDFSLSIDGAEYRLNMNINDVTDTLGSDYEYSEAMSCDYDGLDKTYQYDAATFYTNPLAEGDTVFEIYTENSGVSTSRGIVVGASKEDVLSAYGEEYEEEDGLLIYRLDGGRATLCFEIENGAVWAIYLTTLSV